MWIGCAGHASCALAGPLMSHGASRANGANRRIRCGSSIFLSPVEIRTLRLVAHFSSIHRAWGSSGRCGSMLTSAVHLATRDNPGGGGGHVSWGGGGPSSKPLPAVIEQAVSAWYSSTVGYIFNSIIMERRKFLAW